MTAVTVERWVWTGALAAYLEAETGFPVGRAQAPKAEPPHYVVYVIPGGSYDAQGPLDGNYGDAGMVYQINGVGLRDDQAEWLLDRARELLLGQATTDMSLPDGWRLKGVSPDGGGPGGVEYSGSPPNRRFTASERFVVSVTPDR